MTPLHDLEFTSYEEKPGRAILDYLEIPLRYPRAMWVPFFLVLGLSVLLALLAPRKYRSGTLILVESKTLSESMVAPVSAEGIAQRLLTIRQVVTSRTRLEEVIKKTDAYPEMRDQPSHVVVEAMRKAIEIRVQANDAFVIEYVNNDPYKAMMVTNLLATKFTEDASALREDLTNKAFAFLQQNLEEARRAVEEREIALRRHKQLYWGALPEQLDSNLRILQQHQQEQQTLSENLRGLEERRAALERSLLEGRRLTAAGSEGDLTQLRAAYRTLRGRYTDDHPDVKAVKSRIERLEKQASAGTPEPATSAASAETASLSQSLRLVESEIEALKARRERLDERIATFQARVEATPKAEQELSALARDYQQLRENYNIALKKENDALMARRLEEYWKGGYFRVLDPAYLPRRAIRPYGSLLVLGGLVIGLLGGLFWAVAADLADRSVKTERDLEGLAGPLLASLPRMTGSTRPRSGFWGRKAVPSVSPGTPAEAPSSDHPASIGDPVVAALLASKGEAFETLRVLRTKVKSAGAERPWRCFGVVGATRGEGASTVALGLAAALAHEPDQRVLLVEADLDTPALETTLGLDPRPGLAERLEGSTDAEPRPALSRGLFVLPAGRRSDPTAEVLVSEPMERLTASLRASFDYVVFDCPPLDGSADSVVLQALLDGYLLVVRARHAPREVIRRALSRLRPDAVRGVVYNDHTEILSRWLDRRRGVR